MFPIGPVYNGKRQYTLRAINPIPGRSPLLLGIIDTLESTVIGRQVTGNFDDTVSGGQLDSKFSYAFGLYKLEFWREKFFGNGYDTLIDTCWLDWRDAGLRLQGHLPVSMGNALDLRIDYYSDTNIVFSYYGGSPTDVNITETNRHIKHWELLGTIYEDSTAVVPLKGPFYSHNFDYYTTHYPLYGKDTIYHPHTLQHMFYGQMTLDLRIDDTIFTRDTLPQNPTNYNINQ